MHAAMAHGLAHTLEHTHAAHASVVKPDAPTQEDSQQEDAAPDVTTHSLQAEVEAAQLEKQRHVDAAGLLQQQVDTLQRQLAECIDARVGVERDRKQLQQQMMEAGQLSTVCGSPVGPGQLRGYDSTPQSGVKRASRLTGPQFEDWEKLQLRILKAERALEYERMTSSGLRRLVDSQRTAAIAGQTAASSQHQLQAELLAARQECAQKTQEAEALRVALELGDQTVAQLRQQLGESEVAKKSTHEEEGAWKQKLEEADKATREECDALAAMVEQLMTDCADLGSKLNAKSSALAAAQAQLQAALSGNSRRQGQQKSGAEKPGSSYTAITIGESGPRASKAAELPGGLSDAQWKLLSLSECVSQLRHSLSELRASENGIDSSSSQPGGLNSISDSMSGAQLQGEQQHCQQQMGGRLRAKHSRQPSKPIVELQLPDGELHRRISELAALMLELEEQVEAELEQQKQRRFPQQQGQPAQQQHTNSSNHSTNANNASHTPITHIQQPNHRQDPSHPHSLSNHPLNHLTDSDRNPQCSDSDRTHTPPPHQPQLVSPPSSGNLWERRLTKSMSVSSLNGMTPCATSTQQQQQQQQLLSVDVGDGGGALDAFDPPEIQQVVKPKHYVVHRHPHDSHEEGAVLSEDEYDDEEMLKSRRRGRRNKEGGSWGLWNWLSGGA